ncbi:MAG: hypothetical protein GF398_05840 [Chitinivibrionales bacterium]|nr:hypothetical protein [Chitinivibrionales bacterium]
MSATHCYSCAMPLGPETKGPSQSYCMYCSDETGKLKSREEVQFGVSQWLKQWQLDIDDATAAQRAAFYMQAMPAWAQ